MSHIPYHNRVFFYGADGIINAYGYVRFRKRQKGIKNADPKRDVKHDLYPVFLPDSNHTNKGKLLGLAKKFMLLKGSIMV